MIKKVNKQKTVEYVEEDIFCDLCEAVITKDSAMITLVPQIAEAAGRSFADQQKIDVCSVDCLTANIGAAGLVMNTKMFPELRSKQGAMPRALRVGYEDRIKESLNGKYIKPAAVKPYSQADIDMWKTLETR